MMSSMEKIIGYEFRAMAVNERGRQVPKSMSSNFFAVFHVNQRENENHDPNLGAEPLNMRRSMHGIWFVTFQGALPTFTHYIVVDLVQSVITEPLLNIAIFCNKTDI